MLTFAQERASRTVGREASRLGELAELQRLAARWSQYMRRRLKLAYNPWAVGRRVSPTTMSSFALRAAARAASRRAPRAASQVAKAAAYSVLARNAAPSAVPRAAVTVRSIFIFSSRRSQQSAPRRRAA